MIKIAIHGAPRSGTTWLGEIINSSPNVCYKFQPLFSYARKNYLNSSSSSVEIQNFFESLLDLEDAFCNQSNERASGELPNFSKSGITHIAYKEVRYHHILPNLLRKDSALKLVLLIRNPIDMIASWFRAPREFRSDLGWKIEEEWRYALKKNLNNPENFYGFEKWRESSMLFLELQKQYTDRVFILKYSDLVAYTEKKSEQLYQFLDLPLRQQTIKFLKDCQIGSSKTSYGVYRSPQTSSISFMNDFPSIVAEVKKDTHGTVLEDFLS